MKRLEQIAARLEKATPGPWAYAYEYTCLVAISKTREPYTEGTKGSPSGFGGEAELDLDSGINNDDKSEANGQFIAHSRADIETLLEVVKMQREALEFYANERNWHYTTYDNYHNMHDDTRTIGEKHTHTHRDVSGKRAFEALAEADKLLAESKA